MKKEDINKKQYQAKDYEWPILQSEPELEIPANVFWWTNAQLLLAGAMSLRTTFRDIEICLSWSWSWCGSERYKMFNLSNYLYARLLQM